jgi:hypothetical protein
MAFMRQRRQVKMRPRLLVVEGEERIDLSRVKQWSRRHE